jgi:ribosomal protein S18 acetylase RimI-like enzyme
MSVSIIPYRPTDESAIIAITFKTGLMGEDLTGRGYVEDARLWYLIFIGYYTRYEPENFFVAVDPESNQVVGFICGTTDTQTQEARFHKKMVPRIGLHFFGYTSWRYPRTFKNVFGLIRGYSSGSEDVENDPIISQYPAHLHINLLPGYQGQGIGTRLMMQFEEHMIGLGAKGLHLGTTNQNTKAVPFYRKMGYEIVHESEIFPHPLFDDLRYLMFAKEL